MSNYQINVKTVLNTKEIEAQLAGIKNKKVSITADNKFVTTVTQGTNALNQQLKVTEKINKSTGESTKKTQQMSNAQMGFNARIKEAITSATQWAIAMGLLYGTLRKVEEGFQFIYDLDNQMNNIQMITKGTDEETKALANTYSQLATQLSSNTLDVAKNAEEWLRQGRSVADTNTLIQTSMIFSKVGMLDAAQAANLLTSSINGYGISAQEAMSVVDKMSAIDVAAATSTEELASALSETANSARLAGATLDEALSYIAVVSDVTRQSAESIGNSFKTIYARIQQVKLGSLVDEEGNDISNASKVLKEYGITLTDVVTGDFKPVGEVFDELAIKWKTLNNMQKSELATVIAGFYKSLWLEYMETYKYTVYKFI